MPASLYLFVNLFAKETGGTEYKAQDYDNETNQLLIGGAAGNAANGEDFQAAK